jgi:hypothetical protein
MDHTSNFDVLQLAKENTRDSYSIALDFLMVRAELKTRGTAINSIPALKPENKSLYSFDENIIIVAAYANGIDRKSTNRKFQS